MNTVNAGTQLARGLRDICGAEYVAEDPAELRRGQILGSAPAVGVTPGSTDEVAAILRLANQHSLSVVPAGGLTQQQVGNSTISVLLNTSRLIEVEHYDSGDLTVGIGAGCTVTQLSSMVAADGLLFAADPPLPERATIGGLLATGTTGPLRHGYGGLRDYCIGIRFVTGDGRKGKGGGRVVKNVAGYDMMKLLIGSHGTLAVITGASFKLFPAPRQTRTFVAQFATAAEALQFRDVILRSPLSPMCLEIVSPGALGKVLPGVASTGAWLIAVRASGSDAVLTRYRAELGSAVTGETVGEQEFELWRAIENFPFYGLTEEESQAHFFLSPMVPILSLHVPLGEVGDTIRQLEQRMTPDVISMALVGRVGVGNLVVLLRAENLELPAELHIDIIEKLRRSLSPHASLLVRSGVPHELGKWPMTPTHLDSMRAVKRALDPNDILNRGRFLV